MATFSKRKKKWLADVRKSGIRATKVFSKKYDARKWAAEIERQIEAGEYHKAKRLNLTVEQSIDRYIKEVSPTKKGNIKEIQKFNIIKRYDWLMDMNISQVEGLHIARYRDERLQTVSAATLNRDLNLLGHVFSVAIKDWSLPISNPVQAIRRPKVPANTARDRRLQKGELDTLLEACNAYCNPYLAHLIRFAVETGMRRGEMLALLWNDIDIEGRALSIKESKTGEGRTIPLSTRAISILDSIDKHESGLVFPFPSPASASVAFHRACKSAGIKDLRFHDLRHEATSRFFELGLNPMQVSAITGHKTLQMLKRYTHLKATDLADMLG